MRDEQAKNIDFDDPFSSAQNYRLSAGNSTVICFRLSLAYLQLNCVVHACVYASM